MKNINQKAIDAFGTRNEEMHHDSPCCDFGPRYGRLTTYLDVQLVKKWGVLNFPPEKRSDLKILDVGAGMGRITVHLAKMAKHCVAIEPFSKFYSVLKSRSVLKNIETHQSTLCEYAKTAKQHFDIVWVSGVMPYLADNELSYFMDNIRNLLMPDGLLINRELASRKMTIQRQDILTISRPPLILKQFGEKAGFELVRYRHAYPPDLPKKIFNKWPTRITKFIWNMSRHKVSYPLWEFFSTLNIKHSSHYLVYLFRKN